ncbi:HNH endonuclease family protein [Thermoactinospora rubra]|uniref:HNH endonuclease family protein n=1 Tax=Thermoactinospora rubra TaxID=1088767 RepID=UPI0019824E64|nr:HNH endonuclease family protein [Thermoactinospora rubra]
MSTRDAIALLAGTVMIVSLLGHTEATPPTPPPTPASPLANTDGTRPGLAPLTTSADRRHARTLIHRLPTRRMGPKTGYTRRHYGKNWTDAAPGVPYARNGCRTRDDLLTRDGTDLRKNGCHVTALHLDDPYTGRRLTRPSDIQVDHVIPLSYAWRMGARHWPKPKRLAFAQDPLNLLPVHGEANEAKDGSGPAAWLPPQRRIRCSYAVRWAQVALKYDLPVTPADKATMLAQCR